MARESPYFREIVAELFEKFGKDNLNATDYAKYLGRSEEYVATRIRNGVLPGRVDDTNKKTEYIIPIKSIALFEIRCAEH